MLEIDYDEGQRSYAGSVRGFASAHDDVWHQPRARSQFPEDVWSGLAALGLLGLTSADSGAAAIDVVAAFEALGSAGCPGPLWQTALAVGALTGEEQAAVASGASVVAVGPVDRLPWAARADLALELVRLTPDGGLLRRWGTVSRCEPVILLGFEPAGRAMDERGDELSVDARTACLTYLALAGYLAGAGLRVIDDVSSYVGSRTQFKRTLDRFQAVAHPLAGCHARLAAAISLTRQGAARMDDGTGQPIDVAAAVGSAARAARAAIYQAHQAYGGIGYAEEGPLSWIGSRIGQLATEAQALWRAVPLEQVLSWAPS